MTSVPSSPDPESGPPTRPATGRRRVPAVPFLSVGRLEDVSPGSLLVAMVTRVTQGHSGRPLVLGAVAGFAFVAIQLVALLRIAAEMLPYPELQALAAAGWLLAFAPWVLRSARVYLSARADGKPG